MQPSPRAETSSLLLPSLRFCIVPPLPCTTPVATLAANQTIATIKTRCGHRGPPQQLGVFFVADLFHPVDRLAIEVFQDSYVRHRRSGRGAMPVLLSRRAPDDVAG